MAKKLKSTTSESVEITTTPLEDPNTVEKTGWDTVNPGPALLWSGLFPGSTGTPLNWISSLQSSAVYACVKILSEDIAKLPVCVKQILPKGGARIDPTHRVAKMLRKPNRWMNPFEFWRYLVTCHQLRGNAYAVIMRNRRGEATSMLPISPDRVTISITNEGDLIYTVSHPLFDMGTTLQVPSENMLHVRGMTLGDGIFGQSPIAYAGDSIGLAIAQQRHAALLFGQGAVLSGVLSTPNKLSAESSKRIKQSWNDAHQGGVNAHKIAVLEEGLEFTPVSMSAADSQLLESRKYSSEEIARIFRVPLHKINVLDHATFSNIDSQSQSYLDESLLPIARLFEEALQDLLLFDSERGRIEIEFNFEELLRADVQTRYASYQVGINNGFLTANEIRIREGMEPSDDPEADKLHFPLNMTNPDNTAPKKPKPKKPPAKSIESP